MPLAINGTLPKMWDWLSSAVDGGKADYMNSVVEVWAGKDSVSHVFLYILIYIFIKFSLTFNFCGYIYRCGLYEV